MRNQRLSVIVDNVITEMKKVNCRLLDSDIVRAINSSSYDIINNEIVNIFVVTRDLVKDN